jgi:thymidylate synthase (FAD)
MKVRLISQTTGSGEFQGKTAEDIIVYAARVSSSREDKFANPEGLLKYCMDNYHWSVFETSSMTFEIDTSIAVTRQLLRHRSFTFQEFSTRYSEVTGVEDIELREQAVKNRQSSTDKIGALFFDEHGSGYEIVPMYMHDHDDWMNRARRAVDTITNLYHEGIENGIAKECVRNILPLASSTKLFMTGNIRSWITFFNIRCDEHTQKETREVANAIKSIFKENLPIISKALNY